MAVLTVQNVSKYWGVELLFKDIQFLLNNGEKMALVGRNGTGKSTLLKMLMGRMEYDEGAIILAGGCRVGYLSQDPEFTPGHTLLQEAEAVFSHLQKWERDLRHLESRMGAVSDETELQLIMEEYTRVTAQYEAAGGYDGPARTKMVLFGLGFTEADLHKRVEILSGGQKVRLGLAKMLLEEPDLMLLDEPTNHLDLQATEWLEGHFSSMKSAAILVSHDRYFLDKVITRTLELENHGSEVYHGNYSYYLAEKRRREEALLDAYQRQQQEVSKLQFFINKWKAGTRSTMAKSREKMLERMNIMERPHLQHKEMKLDFELDYESGHDVLMVENMTKEFDGRRVLSEVNLQLFKGDRVALVGPNGAGKSTFLKIVHGLLKQSAGAYRWGVGVQRGYFSQDLDALDYSRTCMEEMLEIPGFTKFDAHALLGRFLFSGEDAHKSIAQCSGGERNRLILAKLMVTGANVLLLDEPTNHLDLQAKGVLEESLVEYPGTVLLVSHDRYFIDRVATKIWEFGPTGVTPYEGNYSAYQAEKARRAWLAAQEQMVSETRASTVASPAARQESPQGRSTRKEERKASEALRRLEQEIQQLEVRKAELEERMSRTDLYKSASGREVVAAYQAVQGELERLYDEWARVAG